MISSAERARWREHTRVLERSTSIVGVMAILSLVPLWVIIDFTVAPAHARQFLLWRVADCLACLPAATVVLRSNRLGAVRAAMVMSLVATGAVIAFMLPLVAEHAWVYTFGFSLVFWGAGLIMTWPIGCTIVGFGLIFAAFLLAHVLHGNRHDVEFLGTAFYLGSAAFIAAAVIQTRRRLELRACLMAFQLEERNAALRVAVRSLEDAQARLVESEKQSALGRLLAGLSHEINNPLNVIQNNLEPVEGYVADLVQVVDAARGGEPVEELCRRLDVDFIKGDVGEAIAVMRAATQRIAKIHTDLRAFIRGDAPDMVESDLNEGLRATVTMLRRSLPEGVQLDAAYGDLPHFCFQPGQINQVLFNLLDNAIDAVEGSGTVSVESALCSDAIRIAIADTGPGVREDAVGRLFEPFFTTKGVGQGTGLGLATCYRIVRNHGGTIELDRAYRGGARFVVLLPFRAGERLRIERAALPPPRAA